MSIGDADVTFLSPKYTVLVPPPSQENTTLFLNKLIFIVVSSLIVNWSLWG